MEEGGDDITQSIIEQLESDLHPYSLTYEDRWYVTRYIVKRKKAELQERLSEIVIRMREIRVRQTELESQR